MISIMKKKLLIFIAVISMLALPCAAAGIDDSSNETDLSSLSVDEVARAFSIIFPHTAGKDAELNQLAKFILDKPMTANSKAMKAGETTAVDYSSLIQLMLMLGVTQEDIEYMENTVLPIYVYLMGNRTPPANADIDYKLDTIAKAPFDGCHFGIGHMLNTYKFSGVDTCECINAGGKPKVNGAYPWGVVQVGDNIIWGTINNILCMPSWRTMTSISSNNAYENECWVCEYEMGRRKNAGANGDIMRPRVYKYNTKTGFVDDITPSYNKATVLEDCLGLRSAATHNGVVFLGGPGLDSNAGQTSTTSAFIAMDTEGNYLGQSAMNDVDGCTVTNVRRWLVHDNVLYCAVGIKDKNGVNKGAILRWYGDVKDPFNFRIIGYVANDAGEICFHNGRLYVGGWPTTNLQQSAIFESPLVPEGGFEPNQAVEWEIKWKMDQYEPNPLCRQFEQCSMLRSYKGKLYWSMWFVQYGILQFLEALKVDPATPKGVASLLALFRQATLWRTDDFSKVEMLYGEDRLPNVNVLTGEVILPQPNVSGYRSVYGRAGFDRQFTAYMWASAEYNDQLYIGTMTTEALLQPAVRNTNNPKHQLALSMATSLLGVNEANKGYELYRFKDNDSPAETVSQDGFGNHAQYGIRNIVLNSDSTEMYIGTASPFNVDKHGGWRMLRFRENDQTTGIDSQEIVPASVLVKHESGYVVLSSMNNERIKSVTVTDLSGKTLLSESPATPEAYLFKSELGSGVFIVTVTTASGSWTSKITLR